MKSKAFSHKVGKYWWVFNKPLSTGRHLGVCHNMAWEWNSPGSNFYRFLECS